MRALNCVAIAFLILCLAGAGGRAETVMIDGVVAYVNEHVITVGDVMEAVEPVRRKLMAVYSGAKLREMLEEAFRDALQTLIERDLILDAFEAEDGALPDWAVEQRVNDLVHEVFDDDRDALLGALAKDGVPFDEWRNNIREQIVVGAMRSSNVGQHVRVPASAVRRAYEDTRESFRVPPQVKLRMIVLDAEAQGETREDRLQLMQSLRQRAIDGEDFAVLARTHSEGTKADAGGDWGWIDPNRMLQPVLAGKALALQATGVSEVVETDDVLYLLKVEGRREESVRTFDQVRAEVESDLRRAESDRLYREWIERLGQNAYVKVLEVGVF